MDELKDSAQSLANYNLLVIDGDAIPYMLGWHHKEHQEIAVMHQAVDQWMNDFLAITQAPNYIGIIAADKSRCFRYNVYKYKPYKGNRGEKDEWIKFWEPIVREYLVSKWGFCHAPAHLETDDVVATLAETKTDAIICSPDKDLRQIPGAFYNYKDLGGEKHKGLEIVSKKDAERNFLIQLLIGDTTDNINGVTGMGEVKANKLLAETSEILWWNAVKLAYQKQYGPHYGQLIYEETLAVIQMATPNSTYWSSNAFDFIEYNGYIRKSTDYARSLYNEAERTPSM